MQMLMINITFRIGRPLQAANVIVQVHHSRRAAIVLYMCRVLHGTAKLHWQNYSVGLSRRATASRSAGVPLGARHAGHHQLVGRLACCLCAF